MNRIFFISVLLFSVGLVSCSALNKNRKENSNELLHRKWMLISFQDFDKDFFIQNNAYLDLTEFQLKRAHANVGCNQLNFNIQTQSKHQIKFSELKRTRKYCEQTINLEDRFAEELQKVNQYQIEGHFLTLTDKNGNKIKFVAADWD